MGFLAGQIREVVAAVDGLLRGARQPSGSQLKSINVRKPADMSGMSGRATETVQQKQEDFAAAIDRIHRADSELTAVISEMNERSSTLKTRLEGIRAGVLEVQQQEASATSAAQRHELAAIVAAKTTELRQVMSEAQAASAAIAGRLQAVTAQYRQTGPTSSSTDGTGSEPGPPRDEDHPRISDTQGGIHRQPDGPTITAAPTYPMDDERG